MAPRKLDQRGESVVTEAGDDKVMRKRDAFETEKTLTKKIKINAQRVDEEGQDKTPHMAKKPPPLLTPSTIITEEGYWAILEQAWSKMDPELNQRRLSFDIDDNFPYEIDEALLGHLSDILETFTLDQLHQWVTHQRTFHKKLDTKEIYDVLRGSDDGFTDHRAFVMSLGKAYYDAVSTNPKKYGREDVPFEEFLYVVNRVCRKKYGKSFWQMKEKASTDVSGRSSTVEKQLSNASDSASSNTEYKTPLDNKAVESHGAHTVPAHTKLPDSAEITNTVVWKSLEDSWSGVAGRYHRSQLCSASTHDRQKVANGLGVGQMAENLRRFLEGLTAAQLRDWYTHISWMLFSLDREDIYGWMRGVTDHAFVAARCFIIACGKNYYEAVQDNPARYATHVVSLDLLCLAAGVAHKKHGLGFKFNEVIPIATGSNKAAWPKRYGTNGANKD